MKKDENVQWYPIRVENVKILEREREKILEIARSITLHSVPCEWVTFRSLIIGILRIQRVMFTLYNFSNSDALTSFVIITDDEGEEDALSIVSTPPSSPNERGCVHGLFIAPTGSCVSAPKATRACELLFASTGDGSAPEMEFCCEGDALCWHDRSGAETSLGSKRKPGSFYTFVIIDEDMDEDTLSTKSTPVVSPRTPCSMSPQSPPHQACPNERGDVF